MIALLNRACYIYIYPLMLIWVIHKAIFIQRQMTMWEQFAATINEYSNQLGKDQMCNCIKTPLFH